MLPDITLVGGSNVTLSGDSSAITFSAAGGITSGGWLAVGNTTGTTSSMTHELSVQAVSGAGDIYIGFDAGSIVISASGAASATSMEFSAVGNTTGTTSSMTQAITAQTLSGGGIVSVGFNAGSVVISASTAATNPVLSLFAVSNTTQSTTSGVNAAGSISFAGAGGVSVGVSGSSVVISGATTVASGTVGNRFALGNTTGQTSSTTNTLSLFSVSGAGGISLGYSTTGAGAGVLIISGDTGSGVTSATSMGLSAVGNTTGTTSSMSHEITAATLLGAGIVSVGFQAGSVIFSATTVAQSVQTIGGFAVGNTTGSSSSTTFDARSITVSGAGAASVGYSSNNILIVSVPPQSAPDRCWVSILCRGGRGQRRYLRLQCDYLGTSRRCFRHLNGSYRDRQYDGGNLVDDPCNNSIDAVGSRYC